MEKFVFSITTMVICLFANSIILSSMILILLSGLTIIKGGLPLSFYIKLMLIPFSFLIMGTLTIAIIFIKPTDTAFFHFHLGNILLGITPNSFLLAFKVFMKALGAVSCLYFLSLTTPMVDLISVLRKLKVPSLFIELMGLIYRFIFLLLETANQMFVAQSSRLGYATLKNGYRSLGQLVSTLFVYSYKRSNNLYTALEARCYNGELKVLEKKYPVSKQNITFIISVDGILLLVTILAGGKLL